MGNSSKKKEEQQLMLDGSLFTEYITVEKDPETSGLEAMEDRAMVRYVEKHHALISKLSELGLPLPGQQFRLITRRTFNAIQFLEYIVSEEKKILDLRMAIYSINYYAARLLLAMIDKEDIAGGGEESRAEGGDRAFQHRLLCGARHGFICQRSRPEH